MLLTRKPWPGLYDAVIRRIGQSVFEHLGRDAAEEKRMLKVAWDDICTWPVLKLPGSSELSFSLLGKKFKVFFPFKKGQLQILGPSNQSVTLTCLGVNLEGELRLLQQLFMEPRYFMIFWGRRD